MGNQNQNDATSEPWKVPDLVLTDEGIELTIHFCTDPDCLMFGAPDHAAFHNDAAWKETP